MAKFDSKSFNPQAFGAYVKRIPNVTKNELAKSGAVGSNEQARSALSNQTGSLYARIPYFGRISGSTSQNNDGATNIQSTNTTTYEQGFVVASRMDSWTERSFSKNITAGVDFMDNVAAQIADYKMEVKQNMLLAILQGVFSMNTVGGTVAANAAAEFLAKHVYDITGEASADDQVVSAATLNKAIQKACGDNKGKFKLVYCHSAVATNLENLKLLAYLKYTDAQGIERDLEMGTWNGRLVIIDDSMPTVNVEATDDAAAYTKYTTYVLGEGAIGFEPVGAKVPYEMVRDAKLHGGEDTLISRKRNAVSVAGVSYLKASQATNSPTDAELANGKNWSLVSSENKTIAHKAVPIARIISRG